MSSVLADLPAALAPWIGLFGGLAGIGALGVSLRANKHADDGNRIARTSNQLVRESNQIARDAQAQADESLRLAQAQDQRESRPGVTWRYVPLSEYTLTSQVIAVRIDQDVDWAAVSLQGLYLDGAPVEVPSIVAFGGVASKVPHYTVGQKVHYGLHDQLPRSTWIPAGSDLVYDLAVDLNSSFAEMSIILRVEFGRAGITWPAQAIEIDPWRKDRAPTHRRR